MYEGSDQRVDFQEQGGLCVRNEREQVCKEFIRQYKARLATLTDVSKADVCVKCIEGGDYLMRAIGYVLRNPMAAGLGVLPTTYRWSSAGVYFNPERMTPGCALSRGMQTVGDVGVRKLRSVLRSRYRLPDDYVLTSDGMVCPECYVDWQAVEELFVYPARLLYMMSKNDDMEMELTGDILRKTKYTDAELHGSVSELCREMFRCESADGLSVENRCRLAKELRKRYGCLVCRASSGQGSGVPYRISAFVSVGGDVVLPPG